MNDGHDGDDDGPAVKAHTAQPSSTHRHKDKHKYIKYSYNQPPYAHGHGHSHGHRSLLVPQPRQSMQPRRHHGRHRTPSHARRTYTSWLAGWLAGWLGSARVCVRRAFIPPADQTRPDQTMTRRERACQARPKTGSASRSGKSPGGSGDRVCHVRCRLPLRRASVYLGVVVLRV
jgi:hypothetical protein